MPLLCIYDEKQRGFFFLNVCQIGSYLFIGLSMDLKGTQTVDIATMGLPYIYILIF